jgi:hypothetical protein
MTQDIRPSILTNKLTVEAPATPLVLEQQFISTLVGTTPNVKNIQYTYSHGSATVVTSFLNGQDGQELNILGNGNTTLAVSGNIVTNTGSSKLLAANLVYEFTFFGTKWYEGE